MSEPMFAVPADVDRATGALNRSLGDLAGGSGVVTVRSVDGGSADAAISRLIDVTGRTSTTFATHIASVITTIVTGVAEVVAADQVGLGGGGEADIGSMPSGAGWRSA